MNNFEKMMQDADKVDPAVNERSRCDECEHDTSLRYMYVRNNSICTRTLCTDCLVTEIMNAVDHYLMDTAESRDPEILNDPEILTLLDYDSPIAIKLERADVSIIRVENTASILPDVTTFAIVVRNVFTEAYHVRLMTVINHDEFVDALKENLAILFPDSKYVDDVQPQE